LKKIKNLGNRKTRNILELKIDKIVADAAEKVILLGALNSLSPRSSSFTNLVIGKKSTNPFLRFLDSFGKNVEIF
jgi:hypothetical protein